MKRLALGLAALAALTCASSVSALPLPPARFVTLNEDVILIKNDRRRGLYEPANRGRHVGWTRGRHRGWAQSRRFYR